MKNKVNKELMKKKERKKEGKHVIYIVVSSS